MTVTAHYAADLSSGALLLERVKLGTGGQCCNEECTRAGRYRIRIAGHYLPAEGRVYRYSFLCPKCAKAAIELWNELTGRRGDEVAYPQLGVSTTQDTNTITRQKGI